MYIQYIDTFCKTDVNVKSCLVSILLLMQTYGFILIVNLSISFNVVT